MQRMKVEAQKKQSKSQQTSHPEAQEACPSPTTPEARLKVQEACQQHVANLGAQEALHQTQEVCLRKLAFHFLS